MRNFKAVIKKCWRWCSTTVCWRRTNSSIKTNLDENRFRQSLKIYTGTQAVSNFRPTAAKMIYEKFGGDAIWDMSCGWGGRLLGFLSSSRPKYIGTEPSSRTFEGLQKDKKRFFLLDKVSRIT